MLIIIIPYNKPDLKCYILVFSIAYISLNWLFIKEQEGNKNTSRGKEKTEIFPCRSL